MLSPETAADQKRSRAVRPAQLLEKLAQLAAENDEFRRQRAENLRETVELSKIILQREAELKNAEDELADISREYHYVLTRMLHREKKGLAIQQRKIEWLRAVAIILLAIPGRGWLNRRLNRLVAIPRTKALHEGGLFRADDYLEKYPDVASSGMDPLLHVLRHGLDEDRIQL